MKNDEALNPVIGVIIMVAITVILAAVIAMFVFNTNPFTKSYPETITVKEITQVKGKEGVIDTNGNGYYWTGFSKNPFIVGNTYQIQYTVLDNERYIQKYEALVKVADTEPFVCRINATGVCK
jgi:flagellin-like protein